MRRSAIRALIPCLAFALGTAVLCACGGGGGGGSSDGSDGDLVLVEFALVDQDGNPSGATGTENAYRNNRLRFTFSAPVAPESVSDRTIQIGIPSGTNLFVTAVGRFEVDGNVVTFDPTTSAIGGHNPFGFQPNAVYSVTVKGPPNLLLVETGEGKTVLETFTTTFTTTDLYLPDLDQPRIESVYPSPVDPIPADRFGSEAQDLWVLSGDDVRVRFSEAMNPGTIDSASTFTVLNVDRNREVFGTFRFSEDAHEVTFRPTFGFGRGPYVIRVNVTTDVTDLAGNAISNPIEWEFLTEFDSTAVNEGLLEEFFDDSSMEDADFVPTGSAGLASWDPQNDPGHLVSTFGVSSATVPSNTQGSSNYIPLGGLGIWNSCRCQMWYTSSEVGSAGTISGIKFMPGTTNSPNDVLGNFIVRLCHNNTASGLTNTSFAANFNVGSPVTVINGVSYTLPAAITPGTPVAFPAFTQTFGWNGTDNLILDVSKGTCVAGSQTWDYRSIGTNRRAWSTVQSSPAPTGGMDGGAYRWVVDFRTEKSMAQSRWYQAEDDGPVFLDPIISPTEQPAGTETAILYQGTVDDGGGLPDLTQTSAWTDDPIDLNGYEYVRFQVTFTANLGTGKGPKIAEMILPYLFF